MCQFGEIALVVDVQGGDVRAVVHPELRALLRAEEQVREAIAVDVAAS